MKSKKRKSGAKPPARKVAAVIRHREGKAKKHPEKEPPHNTKGRRK